MEETSEVYPLLYHYTNEQGLYGILDKQCIWATHYKFLNDTSEIVLFRDKLINDLYPFVLEILRELSYQDQNVHGAILADGGLDAVVKDKINTFVNLYYENLSDEIYITSFCGEHKEPFTNENGLLSQWRAYGGDGGFAIVFKTHELEKMLGLEFDAFYYSHLIFDSVVYSDDEEKYKSELSDLVRKISVYLNGLFQGNQEVSNPINEAILSFLSCITRYKHQGFNEEQEVRIVFVPINKNIQEIAKEECCKSKLEKSREFRDKNGKRTPYIELFHSLPTPLPIEKIIVGPHKDKESRAAELRIMLRNTDIKVTVSDIPYQ